MTDQEKLLSEFKWEGFSIQRNTDSNYFLIIATTKERAAFIYNMINTVRLRVEVYIDPETKIYTIGLVFPYNKEKEVEFTYNTGLTSEGYPPLLFLNNGTVKYITTGEQSKENPNQYMYNRPLLNLDPMFSPG